MKTAIVLDKNQQAKLDIIASWDLSKVRYLAVREGVKESEADELVVEYRKYMGLALICPEQQLPMVASVDQIWHAHILYTENYHAFCEAVFGGYLHHEPAFSTDEEKSLGVHMAKMLESFAYVFGSVNGKHWALGADTDAECSARPHNGPGKCRQACRVWPSCGRGNKSRTPAGIHA